MGAQVMSSPIGELLITSRNGALTGITTLKAAGKDDVPSQCLPDDITAETARQLREYFDLRRTSFDLPIRLSGSEFCKRVWLATAEVPFGETATYGDIATRAGSPLACRSVGSCLGRNRLLIVIPCHRIVGKHNIGGFALGLETKEFLLSAERKRGIAPAPQHFF